MKTLHDLVTHLLDVSDVQGDPLDRRRALRASIAGATEVVQRHQWKEYTVDVPVVLQAPVDVQLSVAADGVATFADASDVPEWVASGSVLLSSGLYPIDKALSPTTVQLRGWVGDTVPQGSVKLVHDRHIVSDEVRSVQFIKRQDRRYNEDDLTQESPQRFLSYLFDEHRRQASPMRFTVQRFSNGRRMTEIRLSPAPGHKTTVVARYHRMPVIPSLWHECGNVTIAEQSPTTATLTNSLPINSDLRKSVLLLSGNSQTPEGEIGSDMEGLENLPVASVDVARRLTDTSVELAEPQSQVSGVAGILTHVLDFPEFAWQAATLYAEAHFQRSGRGEVSDYWRIIQMADRQILVAMAQESATADPPGSPVGRLVDTFEADDFDEHGEVDA